MGPPASNPGGEQADAALAIAAGSRNSSDDDSSESIT